MSEVLVIGVSGLLGSYLAEHLLDEGVTVAGTARSTSVLPETIKRKVGLILCDINDREAVARAIADERPDVIFHLAAQSLPAVSWRDPESTFRTNLLGTLNVLEAVRRTGLEAPVVVAGSSAEYAPVAPNQGRITEDFPLGPISPYGASKTAALEVERAYAALGVRVLHLRPFLAVGPRKRGDVCSDFARGIVAVESGLRDALSVGNLAAVRDFLDVRDAARAIWTVAQHGAYGGIYNICSGTGHAVQEILDRLISKARVSVSVRQDPARVRPEDQPILIGDNGRLRALGWTPSMTLDETLDDILAYWRAQPPTTR